MKNILNRLLPLYGLIAVVGGILACRLPTPAKSDCERGISDPSEQDVNYTLQFTGDTFESADWQKSYTVGSQRVSATWLNGAESGLAYLEYLVYNCGYTTADMDAHFSEQNLAEIIFRDYQNLERVATCTDEGGGLTLHEFTADSQDKSYRIRLWIKLDSSTRILMMLLAFPQGSEELLDQYAQEVFPALGACQ